MPPTALELETLNHKIHTRLLDLCVTRFMSEIKKKCPLANIATATSTYPLDAHAGENIDDLIIQQIKYLTAIADMKVIVGDNIEAASRDVRLLFDKGEAVCMEEGHADPACRFRELHDLISRRTRDLAELKN
ncbi:MAG: hypothetical protein Q9226_008712, partial [Calogaya cf. arnoldii]